MLQDLIQNKPMTGHVQLTLRPTNHNTVNISMSGTRFVRNTSEHLDNIPEIIYCTGTNMFKNKSHGISNGKNHRCIYSCLLFKFVK